MTRVTHAEEFGTDAAAPSLLLTLEDGTHVGYSTSRDGHRAPLTAAHLADLVQRAELRSTGQ